MKQLRDYQVADYAAIMAALKENRSVLYQLPTGGGKSIVISKFVSDHKSKRILILAHKRRLLTQMRDHLKESKIPTGFMIAQKEENLDANVVIVSIRTAVKEKRLATLINMKWDYVIIDEARHSRTGSYDTVLEALLEHSPKHQLLGVDATPYRKDRKRLDKHFQYMVVSQENVQTLIDKKYLCKYRVFQTPIGDIEEHVKETAGDFQITDLSKYMRQPKFMNYIVDNYIANGDGRQAILFAVDKEHAKELEKVFIAKGIKSVMQIDSDMSTAEIEKALELYENKKLQILINIEMLTEGVDLPDTGCIIGARPSKSLTLVLQMMGRGTRPKSDGSDLIVLDCCGWTEEFGTISSPKHWSLNPEIDPNNPRKKNKIVGKKEDGTYTEEIEEFMEVIEMSPEEYMMHLSGGLEKAEAVNKTIDEKITDVLNQMRDLCMKVGKETKKDPDFDVDVNHRVGRSIEITYFLSKYAQQKDKYDEDQPGRKYHDTYKPKGTITLGEGNAIYIKFYSYHSDFGKKDTTEVGDYMRMSKFTGAINEKLMDNRNSAKQILELYEEVLDLEKSKINLNEFKEAAKKAKRAKWELAVVEHLKGSEEIKLPSGRNASNYFKEGRYQTIVAIKIPAQKINGYQNKIVIVTEDRWSKGKTSEENKDYVKGEKVWEIIQDGEFMTDILK